MDADVDRRRPRALGEALCVGRQTRGRLHHPLRARDRAGLRPARRRRRPPHGPHRLARRVPLHPRAPPHRLPRPGLDDPPVLRLRQRRADQRPLQDAPRRGRRRPLRRVRHAHPHGPRLRRARLPRRGRPLRRGHRLHRRHGPPLQRDRPRRRHHLHDHLRAGRPHLLHVPRGRRTPGRRHQILDGTLQTDIHKEYIAQKEWLFPPEPHLRLIGDLMAYCAANIPRYKPLSVSGYHIREAGSTAAQELAFTLADGFSYVELGLSRGLDVDRFAPGLSFFFDAHIDFFEEIAKFRAARRIWARWLRDVYNAQTDRAQWLRFHTQTAGVSLTAQQPYNNVVRTAVEALAAILGGTNSLHTNALDETLALPTDQAAEIALRTQSVLRDETGVPTSPTPSAAPGTSRPSPTASRPRPRQCSSRSSPSAARTTDGGDPAALAREASASSRRPHAAPPRDRPRHLGHPPRHRGRLVQRRDRRGRLHLPAAARGRHQAHRRRHRTPRHRHPGTGDPADLRRGGARPARRARPRAPDATTPPSKPRWPRSSTAAAESANLVEPMLAAARAEATLGEICGALREEWGEYRETTGM